MAISALSCIESPKYEILNNIKYMHALLDIKKKIRIGKLYRNEEFGM